MGTKTEEVAEIEVLTPEQVQALPESMKKNVVALTENMRQKELMVLNPLVTRLLELKDRASSLKIEKDEDGNITKESIDEYKAVKADQKTFNGDTGREFTKMKKPYAAITKGLVAIEKTFKKISNEDVKALAETNFQEYEEEKQRKAQEAQDRKDAETNKKIEEANNQAELERQKNSKTTVYNTIKYTRITEEITEKASDGVIDSNEDTLCRLKAEIAQKTFKKIIKGLETNLLEAEVLDELEKSFDRSKNRAVILIDEKLEKFEADREKVRQEALNTAPAPVPPAPPIDNWPSGVDYENDPRTGTGWTENYGEDPEPMNPDVSTGFPVSPDSNTSALVSIDIKTTTPEEHAKKVLNYMYGLKMSVELRIKREGTHPDLEDLINRFAKFNS